MEEGRSVQVVDSTWLKAGVCHGRIPRRLKAKHLSELAQREIVKLFAVHQSFDDVAQLMLIPGLTGKTVSEVLHLCQMRRPPASERTMQVVAVRRTA